eukprot:2624944-Karenia_brevis.AAC.1
MFGWLQRHDIEMIATTAQEKVDDLLSIGVKTEVAKHIVDHVCKNRTIMQGMCIEQKIESL